MTATPNFVWDNIALPDLKVDRVPPTDPDRQWAAADANFYRSTVADLRTAIQAATAVTVRAYGAVGDGITDDTAAIQAAIAANYGKTIYLPRGRYVISTTLFITDRCTHLVGDFDERNNVHGTELAYSGIGPCIQIGTDNGHNWDAGDYDGPQDQTIANLWISHSAPDTNLVSAGAPGVLHYKAGAYGIWDWRAGGITLLNVGLEHFEANFVGIQSDINWFAKIASHYSKYGLYIGPRSDQQTILQLYSFFCDRAVTIDRAGQTRIDYAQLVFCGTNTASSIEIRQGSHGTYVGATWLENSGSGYQGTDSLSMISAGETAGYGAGGSISGPGGTPTTTACQGLEVMSPHCYNILAGQPSHKRYLISVFKCTQVQLHHPTEYINSSLNNFDALVGIQAANAPAAVDCQVEVTGIPNTVVLSKVFQNLGGGTPVLYVNASGTQNSAILGYDTTASHTIRGSVAYAAPAGINGWVLTNSNAGQTGGGNAVVQARQNGSYDSTSGAQFPVALLCQGLATRSAGGNTVRNTALQCQASGAQQNWALESTAGDVQLNTSSGGVFFQRARYDLFEQVNTALSANTNDYAPVNIADSAVMIWSATGAVNVTGLAGGAAGKRLTVFNNGAFTISITNQDALSSAANRFITKGAATFSLVAGGAMDLYYSPSLSRWLIVGAS